MFNSQHEEHLAHSAPCASRFDGFDRGDSCDYDEEGNRIVYGRPTYASLDVDMDDDIEF